MRKDFNFHLHSDNPWLFIAHQIESAGYENPNEAVHPEDRRIIEKYNVSASENHRLRLNLPPEPFQGNPLTAEVVILMLNPGFVERCNVGMYEALDEAEKKRFIKAKCATMSMQDELCVPDDETINAIGEGYWLRKLKPVLGIPDANRKIAIINLLGYFSTKYRAIPKRLFEGDTPLLYTQQYTLRLLNYLMQQGKVIIVSRAVRVWYELLPELKDYDKKVLLNSYLNPTISPRNCRDNGWELIMTALDPPK